MVNYVKLDRLPGFDEDWGPIRARRAGDFFVTSGEVLFQPLEFVELVRSSPA